MLRWLFFLALVPAFAQRPPVILVDGYHLLCESDNLSSPHDFGELQSRLEAEGVTVRFFGTCSFNGKPSIEDLGIALGKLIQSINAPAVDLVSHSMGGLIVRSYLSGKQNAPGAFQPPANAKVRKWVSIATPNFGALIPGIISAFLPDAQAQELVPGNQFLFDLATWNQNHDDLRGVDTLGLIGNAGGFGPLQGSNDGTVAVTSASMSFALPDERTRVLPYCHGAGDLTSILGLGCGAPPLARIQSDNPLSFAAIDSFLAGTDAWKTVGRSPGQDSYLSRYGGELSQTRDSQDRPLSAIQDSPFMTSPPRFGGYSVVIGKPGPRILLIIPAAALLPKLSLAPRMWVSVFGTGLANSTVTVNNQPLTLNYDDNFQINALMPDNVHGLATLAVSNAQGKQTVNVWVEDAVPAIFAAIRNGSTASIYLTGLGSGSPAPTVTLNGAPVPVTFSGPAPGYSGLDQINIQLPAGVTSGDIAVTAGGNTSNTVLLR